MQNDTANRQTTNTQLLFMPRVFDETMHLLQQAQQYFYHYSERDQAQLSVSGKLHYSAEMSRITLRLSAVMAWVMAQRAATAGQMSAEEVAAEYRLQHPEICLQETQGAEFFLSKTVCGLLEKTHKLYERILRLDNTLYSEESQAA